MKNLFVYIIIPISGGNLPACCEEEKGWRKPSKFLGGLPIFKETFQFLRKPSNF